MRAFPLLLSLAGCFTGRTGQPLIGGQRTALRPEIGWLTVGCTGTVVDRRIVLTAAHCLGYKNSVPVWNLFRYDSLGTVGSIRLLRGYSLGTEPGEMDIAVVQLANDFPTTIAQPATITREAPQNGTTLTVFGYGCTAPNGSGGGVKQRVVMTAGSPSGAICPGDSGGPVVVGLPEEGGSVWAVNSSFRVKRSDPSNRTSRFAFAHHAIPVVNAVRRVGGALYDNVSSEVFAGYAQQSGAKLLAGDFNRDGLDDLALAGGAGWTTIPLALKKESGGFEIQNPEVAEFPGWAAEPGVQILSGDFDGDGWGDIAALGRPGWETVPVAYSRPGGFEVKNIKIPEFAYFASTLGVTAVSGDFDGDRQWDIALVGGYGWNSVRIAFSRGRGHLEMKNIAASVFASYAWAPGARPVAGRFDNDRRWDLALVGGNGWKSIPVAFSQQNYTFRTTNEDVDDFPNWTARRCTSGFLIVCFSPKVASGDFDGDGIDDILLAGMPGWRTLAFAFSRYTGGFEPGSLPFDFVPGWAAEPGAQIVAGRFNRDDHVDVALAGAQKWKTVPLLYMFR